ncbi:MAG: hypothetical protein L0Y71_05970 [Gemmataceae bacterium]|nr:hypothetical protein [Gemmataceae bacterium]
MNDFTRIVLAFGSGIIKLLISVVVGVGVGLLVFGITTAGRPEIWEMRGPPGEFFISLGAGLLSGGALLMALFFVPWFFRRAPEPMEEPTLMARPAPRSMRSAPDDSSPPPRSPRPRPEADDAPPAVRPREEPDRGGFFEK